MRLRSCGGRQSKRESMVGLCGCIRMGAKRRRRCLCCGCSCLLRSPSACRLRWLVVLLRIRFHASSAAELPAIVCVLLKQR